MYIYRYLGYDYSSFIWYLIYNVKTVSVTEFYFESQNRKYSVSQYGGWALALLGLLQWQNKKTTLHDFPRFPVQ